MNAKPPIAGIWVVSSLFEVSPQFMDDAKDALESAAAQGRQVVVVEGIEFRWRPTVVEDEIEQARVEGYWQGVHDGQHKSITAQPHAESCASIQMDDMFRGPCDCDKEGGS